MTTGGFGPGNVGSGQQQPLQREIETSAWAESQKVLVGMVPQDEIRAFVESNPDTVWKYSTESGRPQLDHILTRIRVGQEALEESDESLADFYRQFFALLPEEIRQELMYQVMLPLGEQAIEYAVLQRLALFFAAYNAWVNEVTADRSENSAAVRNATLNADLPIIAVAGGLAQASEISELAHTYLGVIGPNHRDYDSMSYILSQVDTIMNETRDVATAIARGEELADQRDRFNDLANRMEAILVSTTNASYGEQLQIFVPMLGSMQTVVAALSLPGASPSLLLAGSVALSGLGRGESDAGLIGPALQQVTEANINGILSLVETGTGSVIAELTDLREELTAFGNRQLGGG